VAHDLQILRRAIEEGAKQIEMVAAERVFDQSLSLTLAQKARELRLVAKDLDSVLRLVAKARIPRARG
jgi:hypothetical protein